MSKTYLKSDHFTGGGSRRLGLPRFEVIYQPPNPAVVYAVAALGDPQPEARARAYETGESCSSGGWCSRRGATTSSAPTPCGAGGRARLVLHGRGPELGALEQLVAELGVGADVDLRPFLGGAGPGPRRARRLRGRDPQPVGGARRDDRGGALRLRRGGDRLADRRAGGDLRRPTGVCFRTATSRDCRARSLFL